MKWWEIGIFKWSLVLFGIAIGAKWPTIFDNWILLFVILAVIGWAVLMPAWIKRK
jgi:hypothetical protein